MSCSGTLAPVHKHLIAAGQVSDEGKDMWKNVFRSEKDAEHVRASHAKVKWYRHCPSLQGAGCVQHVRTSAECCINMPKVERIFCATDGSRCVETHPVLGDFPAGHESVRPERPHDEADGEASQRRGAPGAGSDAPLSWNETIMFIVDMHVTGIGVSTRECNRPGTAAFGIGWQIR